MEKEDAGSSSEEEELNNDLKNVEKQNARAFLRERFLKVVTGIVGK